MSKVADPDVCAQVLCLEAEEQQQVLYAPSPSQHLLIPRGHSSTRLSHLGSTCTPANSDPRKHVHIPAWSSTVATTAGKTCKEVLSNPRFPLSFMLGWRHRDCFPQCLQMHWNSTKSEHLSVLRVRLRIINSTQTTAGQSRSELYPVRCTGWIFSSNISSSLRENSAEIKINSCSVLISIESEIKTRQAGVCFIQTFCVNIYKNKEYEDVGCRYRCRLRLVGLRVPRLMCA